MRTYILPLLLLFAGVLFWTCKEKPIPIPTLSVGKRNVLVEELTGVRCQNCPDGAAILNNLSKQLGDNLIVVSVHAAANYSVPYTGESKEDFRTNKGTEMANYVGAPQGFPAASINRKLVPPETDIFLGPNYWNGEIAAELKNDPVIGVFLETNFNPVTRQLDVSVNLAPETTLSGDHRLTVLITQDSIQDVQLWGVTKIPDYMHRHVLRDILSQSTGDVINEPLNSTSVVKRTYSTVLPAKWDEKHCTVVAFVHHGSAPDKEVLQAAEAHIIK